jgi:N-acetylglutamate synthase-like GNAT family acetyltransferase
MNSRNHRVRRATLDDIAQLTALWNSMRFNADELARRITEFQVAEDAENKIVGAIALEISERQGRIHSEGFTDFSLADQLRPLLWERLHGLATNHGLMRVWTREQAPFWHHSGLNKPDPAAMQKLPVAWQGGRPEWLTLKLRDDIASLVSVDQEFALFMASEKQRTERALQHAKVLKVIATLIALALLGVVLAGAFYVLRHNSGMLGR